MFLLLACGACGSVSDKNMDAAVTIDSPMIDAAVDMATGPCNVNGPFQAPVLVPGVNGPTNDRWGSMSSDELTIYFSDQPATGLDRNLYTATRTSPTGTFATPTLLGGVNTTNLEEHPSVTADGLMLVAESNAFGNGTEVVVATRASTASNFGTLSVVAAVNTASAETDPWISADGLTLMFASNRTGAVHRIYRTTRASIGMTFAAPTEVTELTDAAATAGPVLSADGLEILFYSLRAGGTSGQDIWRATRTSPTGTFGTPQIVAELNTDSPDLPSWISADRCRVIFASSRLGTFDLYIAERQ
jgi:Tol biopolymer transport system component